MSNSIAITVYAKAQPQGSSKGFPIMRANGKMGVSITSANKNLKPYRQAVALTALAEMVNRDIIGPFAGRHVPVAVEFNFYLEKPASVPKRRVHPVVKPDVSKLIRSSEDALTGIFWHDDAQIVQELAYKFYGSPERVEIIVRLIEVAA